MNGLNVRQLPSPINPHASGEKKHPSPKQRQFEHLLLLPPLSAFTNQDRRTL
jgi:hypothetical protein